MGPVCPCEYHYALFIVIFKNTSFCQSFTNFIFWLSMYLGFLSSLDFSQNFSNVYSASRSVIETISSFMRKGWTCCFWQDLWSQKFILSMLQFDYQNLSQPGRLSLMSVHSWMEADALELYHLFGILFIFSSYDTSITFYLLFRDMCLC